MSQVMLSVGEIVFMVNINGYSQIEHRVQAVWHELKRINLRPTLQFDGPGLESFNIRGTFYPAYDHTKTDWPALLAQYVSEGRQLEVNHGSYKSRFPWPDLWVMSDLKTVSKDLIDTGAAQVIEYDFTLKRVGAVA